MINSKFYKVKEAAKKYTMNNKNTRGEDLNEEK